MRTLVKWRWRVRNAITGKLYTTRYAMTEADALDLDPLAVRLEFSEEVRLTPETADEGLDAIYSRQQRP
jgi:hypothetical protein